MIISTSKTVSFNGGKTGVKKPYAITHQKGVGNKNLSMTTLLMSPPKGMVVDHKNHNTLDNRKANLRVCTRAENNRNASLRSNNTSGYPGVRHVLKTSRRPEHWIGYVSFEGKQYTCGYFKTCAKDAYEARQKKARELHGEFAAEAV